ncbi:MAG: VWA domain-containing protein, partial [Steroidobacteraceae bacterium]
MTTDLLMSRSMRGIEARAGLEAFAHRLCKVLDLQPITVQWSSRIQTAAINASGDMVLSDIGDAATVTRATIHHYAGYIVHELLHRRFTTFTWSDGRPYVDTLHNAIEDAWIERRAIREGLTGNIGNLLRELLGTMVTQARESVKDWSDPAQYPFSLAIYLRGYGHTVPTPPELLPIWRTAASRLDACQSTQDTLELARWVFDQLQQPPQQGQNGQGQDDAQDDGQQGQGDGQQGQGSQDQGDDQGGQDGQNAGQGDGQDGQGQEGQGKGQEGAGDAQGAAAGQGKGEPQDEPTGPARAPGGYERAREVEPSQPRPEESAPGGTYTRESVLQARLPSSAPMDIWPTEATVPARLRLEVRKMLENSATEWREGGYRSGTLHRPALASVATGRREVFARRHSTDGVDSAVAIMLDVSGSMFPPGGCTVRDTHRLNMIRDSAPTSRIGLAVATCTALLDSVAQARGESMLITFGTDSVILKSWGQPWRKVLPDLRRLHGQGDTNDYAAARYATEALMTHPAQRKVLISISDGDG